MDGVVIMPETGTKKVTIGTRLASTREKRSKAADKGAADELYEKTAASLEVTGQTEVRDWGTYKPNPLFRQLDWADCD